jgi:hypothetical protein
LLPVEGALRGTVLDELFGEGAADEPVEEGAVADARLGTED